ncbi:hypothetical protein L1987_33735 [Smallanthus sonchifolius]|uniref:Uncharacterized protein n=1 Tax=Smallanthus sonchifolius TaxID=185202 RepID=A0ACB9HR63_9ASTR|nr:hypothetical protein L1987_33735 [Smallanthus sonchifolius]
MFLMPLLIQDRKTRQVLAQGKLPNFANQKTNKHNNLRGCLVEWNLRKLELRFHSLVCLVGFEIGLALEGVEWGLDAETAFG